MCVCVYGGLAHTPSFIRTHTHTHGAQVPRLLRVSELRLEAQRLQRLGQARSRRPPPPQPAPCPGGDKRDAALLQWVRSACALHGVHGLTGGADLGDGRALCCLVRGQGRAACGGGKGGDGRALCCLGRGWARACVRVCVCAWGGAGGTGARGKCGQMSG